MIVSKSLKHKTCQQLFAVVTRNFRSGRIYFNKPQTPQQTSNLGNVPGLSEKIIQVAREPVGPGATKESDKYKNPEYYCYNNFSYFEAEIEMLKYRLPQPSNQSK